METTADEFSMAEMDGPGFVRRSYKGLKEQLRWCYRTGREHKAKFYSIFSFDSVK